MDIKLWRHQEEAINLAKDKSEYALFFEMGCGKTATLINILKDLYNKNKKIHRTLIVCPPIVISQWRTEFLRFSKITPDKIRCLVGSERIRICEANKAPIIITNYEALLMKGLFKEFEKNPFEVVVLDESHKIKNHTSKRTKAAIRLAHMAKYRYILSGTPVLNTPADLFSQFHFLDLGKTFGENFFAFRGTYFYDKNSGMPKHIHFPNWQPRAGIQEQLSNMISSKSFRIKKEECLDLPPLVRQTIHVELSSEQKKNYEEMRDSFITYVNSSACVAQLAITRALRLQQIVSGYIPVIAKSYEICETKAIQYKNTPREEALRELLEELTPNHKVLVWAVFKDNYEQIRRVCKSLGLGYVEVHGEVSSSQREAALKSFNSDAAVRLYLGHPGSGGIGVNLTVASYAIFYSRNFSLEYDLQAEARNHRGGSEIHTKITRIDLVTPGTIDELILEKLAKKESMADSIVFELAKQLAIM